ncbi:MAG: serine/threonine-protein kinase [Sedimentisphaerales bacterium]|jgi:serine/threonine-protein kinase
MNTNKVSNPESVGLYLKSGNRLGKYRLKKCLGTGGHCEVWEARDRVEGIWVALKIPLADIIGRRDNEILLREVRAVSKLRHPNILSVKNADIINEHMILATELSTGTLDDHSKPMSFRRITSIIIQVLEGLAYAHNNHIVHCDVTPGNIFIFPDKRIALGDFGISLEFKRRMKTVDDFGTPGYVAPEQAYGRPTYRSDCFSVGLILYEYITGILPRWPFNWPFRGYERLRERTNLAFVSFIRKSLLIVPEQRFANAGKMLAAMIKALPKSHQKALKVTEQKESDWHKVRREAFVKRYGRLFNAIFRCVNCDEPIAETMQLCPWCGSEKNRFDTRSQFTHICPRCHKGVLPEWRFCPWCYGPGLDSPSSIRSAGVYYHALCKYCDGKLMRFMRYCPWCHRKVRQPWRIRLFPEICGRCGWSIDSDFWNYCPWCKQDLRP